MRMFNQHIVTRAIDAGQIRTDAQHFAFCDKEAKVQADTRVAALVGGSYKPFSR